MNFKILSFLMLFFVLASAQTNINAQSVYKSQIYNAYINGDMNKWATIIHNFEKESPSTIERKLELLSYYYGYIGYLIGAKKNDTAQKFIVKGEKLIADVIKMSPNNATAYAFKGSFLGFRIGMSKFKALSLGQESIESIEKAYKIDPQNIQAVVDRANALYHTPRLFGGDKKEALRLFQEGVTLIETSKSTKNNWLYLNLLTSIAQAYENTDQKKKAAFTYDKILRFEPEFKWVKNELYPALLKKM